jgi:hypothetical protein
MFLVAVGQECPRAGRRHGANPPGRPVLLGGVAQLRRLAAVRRAAATPDPVVAMRGVDAASETIVELAAIA